MTPRYMGIEASRRSKRHDHHTFDRSELIDPIYVYIEGSVMEGQTVICCTFALNVAFDSCSIPLCAEQVINSWYTASKWSFRFYLDHFARGIVIWSMRQAEQIFSEISMQPRVTIACAIYYINADKTAPYLISADNLSSICVRAICSLFEQRVHVRSRSLVRNTARNKAAECEAHLTEPSRAALVVLSFLLRRSRDFSRRQGRTPRVVPLS